MQRIGRVIFTLWFAMAGCGAAQAATFTVNTLLQARDAVAGDGVCETTGGNGVCTLEAAIQESNATPLINDTIQFSVTGTINRNNGDALPECIAQSVTLIGPGSGTLVLDGGNVRRPLCISRGGANSGNAVPTIRISNLVLTRGLIANPSLSSDFGGGGLVVCGRDGAATTISNVVISNSVSNDNGGGGLYVCGQNTATLSNVRITGNRSDTAGGGALVEGTLVATDVVIDSNRVVSKSGNTSLTAGGGLSIYNSSDTNTSSLNRVTITNNSSDVPNGGGAGLSVRISTFGKVTMLDSRIEKNSNTTTHGGGLSISAGVMQLTNVSIMENRSAGDGGGIYLGTEPDGSNLRFGEMLGRQLVLSANNAVNGGGIGVAAGNVAPSGLVHSTLVFGLVSNSGGGIGPNAGNVFPASSSYPFHSNLVAENYIIGRTPAADCASAFNHSGVYSGFNLSDDQSCGFTQASDQQGVPAKLLNPADKGGLFRSVALQATSPAIDRGHNTQDDTGPDARGAPPADGDEDGGRRRDVGAYEFGGFGAVRFTAGSVNAFEGDGTLTLQAVRYGDLASAGTAAVTTEDSGSGNGFAQAGSDYTATTANLAWAAGDGSAKNLTVPLTSDTQTEGIEAFRARISATNTTADIGRINPVNVSLNDGASAGGGSGGSGSSGGGTGAGTGGTGSGSGSGAGSGSGSTGGTGGSATTTPANGTGTGGGGAFAPWLLLAFAGWRRLRRG